MPKKQTSDRLSVLAAKILSGNKIPTYQDTLMLAGSVLSQDETRGRRTPPPTPLHPPFPPQPSLFYKSSTPRSNSLLGAVNGPLNTYQKQVGQQTNILANMLKK